MKKIYVLILALVVALMLPISANALSYSTSATYLRGGAAVDSESDTAASPAFLPISSGVTGDGASFDFSGDAFAEAEVNGLGYSRVEANGILWSGSTYGGAIEALTATATMADSFTNTTSSSVNLTYAFFLAELQLAIADYAGAGVGTIGAPQISYSMEIVGNGSTIWSSSALLEGGKLGHALNKTGVDLGGTYFSASSSEFGYDFDDFVDVLDLGTLGVGDTYDLVASLTVSISTGPFELGGRAGFLDPGAFGFGGAIESSSGGGGTVPEPATMLLLGTGLCGLGVIKKRIKK